METVDMNDPAWVIYMRPDLPMQKSNRIGFEEFGSSTSAYAWSEMALNKTLEGGSSPRQIQDLRHPAKKYLRFHSNKNLRSFYSNRHA